MNSGAFYGAAGRSDAPSTSSATATNTPDAPAPAFDAHASMAQTAPMYTAAARGDPASAGHSAPGQPQASAASMDGSIAELLEAAAKATSESQRQSMAAHGLRKVARNADLRGAALQDETVAAGQKRKRTASPANDEQQEGPAEDRGGSQSPRKRSKQTPVPESHTPMAHTPMSTGSDTAMAFQSPQAQANFALTDARAVGVHSAAALFRQPSGNTAKKHTRPPMSKLFASLQLTPENFLRLQAAAKQYMLDENHPERQNCVGSRGKGDTDMVKLRLFNCCRDFLNDGIGEQFFGPDVPAPTENEVLEGEATPGRKWVWPRDGNKIVSLVTPLLRRMVTNERQRQYAQETRKGGKKKDAREKSQEAALQNIAASPNIAFERTTQTPQPAIDPALNNTPQIQQQSPAYSQPPPTQYPRFLQTQSPSSIYSPMQSLFGNNAPAAFPSGQNSFHPPDQNVIQVLITKNNTKLIPRIDMPSWPSTPHHTLPLSDLTKAVEEEVRGLLKRGFDLGVRGRTKSAAGARPGSSGASQEQQEPTSATTGYQANENDNSERTQDTSLNERQPSQPDQQQQQQNEARSEQQEPSIESGGGGPDRSAETNENEGNSKNSQPPEQQQPQQEPSLDGVAFEIRALTGRGLVLIADEDEWRAVLAEVGRATWMEGILRVVVEVLTS